MVVPKVSISCFDDQNIVPRMMRWLEAHLGWQVIDGITQDPATITYYAPYTMIGRYGQATGKSMAWLTHYEVGNLPKMQLWDRAVQQVDLPLITAPLYGTQVGSAHCLLTPGIDQAHFKLSRKKRPGKGVIGLVGVPQPRKGTQLASLISQLPGVSQVVAVGGAWAEVPGSRRIPYEEMPDFYAQLDLMVCTSTIEGIPAPPLEALACGVPVVVPSGVGIMSQLPPGPAVHHFIPGEPDSLSQTILEALQASSGLARSAAREVVAEYTVEAWCSSHQVALEMLLEGAQ
jgi:hypothetical protein